MIEGWAGRAQRAHDNMLESLVLFAALVLVAHVSGRANAMSALGAQLFFWARVAYGLVYLIGIEWLRTGVWTVSVVGLLLIFLSSCSALLAIRPRASCKMRLDSLNGRDDCHFAQARFAPAKLGHPWGGAMQLLAVISALVIALRKGRQCCERQNR